MFLHTTILVLHPKLNKNIFARPLGREEKTPNLYNESDANNKLTPQHASEELKKANGIDFGFLSDSTIQYTDMIKALEGNKSHYDDNPEQLLVRCSTIIKKK